MIRGGPTGRPASPQKAAWVWEPNIGRVGGVCGFGCRGGADNHVIARKNSRAMRIGARGTHRKRKGEKRAGGGEETRRQKTFAAELGEPTSLGRRSKKTQETPHPNKSAPALKTRCRGGWGQQRAGEGAHSACEEDRGNENIHGSERVGGGKGRG